MGVMGYVGSELCRGRRLGVLLDTVHAGGYKEMSSIFADQYRHRKTSPNAGGVGELRGLSQ